MQLLHPIVHPAIISYEHGGITTGGLNTVAEPQAALTNCVTQDSITISTGILGAGLPSHGSVPLAQLQPQPSVPGGTQPDGIWGFLRNPLSIQSSVRLVWLVTGMVGD